MTTRLFPSPSPAERAVLGEATTEITAYRPTRRDDPVEQLKLGCDWTLFRATTCPDCGLPAWTAGHSAVVTRPDAWFFRAMDEGDLAITTTAPAVAAPEITQVSVSPVLRAAAALLLLGLTVLGSGCGGAPRSVVEFVSFVGTFGVPMADDDGSLSKDFRGVRHPMHALADADGNLFSEVEVVVTRPDAPPTGFAMTLPIDPADGYFEGRLELLPAHLSVGDGCGSWLQLRVVLPATGAVGDGEYSDTEVFSDVAGARPGA